jgi:uncharacterized membrane protein
MEMMDWVIDVTIRILEGAGVVVIAVGFITSTVIAFISFLKKHKDAYLEYRRQLSRAILLGLEFLVAADIIRTVAVELTFSSIGVLAILIIIRTFLSFTLEVEISGKWPWQGGEGTPVEH